MGKKLQESCKNNNLEKKKIKSCFSLLSWPAEIKARRSHKPQRDGAVALLEQVSEDGGRSGKHPMGRAPALPHHLGHLHWPGHWGAKWHWDMNLSPPYHWGCVLESLTESGSEEIQNAKMPKLKFLSILIKSSMIAELFSAWSQMDFQAGKFMRSKQLELNKHLQASGYPGRGQTKRKKETWQQILATDF